jgi:hypothetical protein
MLATLQPPRGHRRRRLARLLLGLLLGLALPVAATEVPIGGGFRIVYSAFNSTFIQPEIAQRYQLRRGRDAGLINIAVVDSANRTHPALLSGRVSNIFQQQQSLEFITIDEGDAIYYLAPFEIDGESFLSFTVTVDSAGQPLKSFNFKKRFYEQ